MEAMSPNDVFGDARRFVMQEVDRINNYLQVEKRKGSTLFNFKDKVQVILSTEPYLTDDIRKEVCLEFEAVGWSKVESVKSEEQGERPGLILYTLYYAN